MSESTQQQARRKVMDILAQRDHSESEVRKKLHEKFRDEADAESIIEDAIAYAKKNRWLADPADLTQSAADVLHRKNKGIQYINNFLTEKGLPTVAIDREQELEKARQLLRGKFPNFETASREEKVKMARFLAGRGFDEDTVNSLVTFEFD